MYSLKPVISLYQYVTLFHALYLLGRSLKIQTPVFTQLLTPNPTPVNTWGPHKIHSLSLLGHSLQIRLQFLLCRPLKIPPGANPESDSIPYSGTYLESNPGTYSVAHCKSGLSTYSAISPKSTLAPTLLSILTPTLTSALTFISQRWR